MCVNTRTHGFCAMDFARALWASFCFRLMLGCNVTFMLVSVNITVDRIRRHQYEIPMGYTLPVSLCTKLSHILTKVNTADLGNGTYTKVMRISLDSQRSLCRTQLINHDAPPSEGCNGTIALSTPSPLCQ